MAKENLVKASKGGKTAVFSERVWATGQPQRYGWHSESDFETRKKLPAEILEFAEIRKKVNPEPVKAVEVLEVKEIKTVKDEPTTQVAEKAKPKRKPAAKKAAKKGEKK